MNGRTVSHRQIPLGPADNGGGCHGLMWHDGKLWIVANRIKAILRVDPKTWTPEFIIPITTARWHGCAWDASHPGGAIWMVTGSSDINRYVMQNGKLHHTTTCGLMKYSATTGQLLETAEFADGTADAHGLDMHNGKLISCDAGVGPPGFEGTGSPSAGYVFEINFV
jgi:streptogramin lyase